MKVIILAAGYATRLYPLTLNQPKPLLEVGGKPMINHVLDNLAPIGGIDRVYVVTNARFTPHFETWACGEKRSGLPITVVNDGSSDDRNKLGAIGDIHYVLKSQAVEDDVVVVAGDNLFSQSLAGFGARIREQAAPVLAVYDVGSLELMRKYAAITTDATGRIVFFEEKPPEPKTTMAGIALYYYPRTVLPLIREYIAGGNNPDQPGRLVQWLYPRTAFYTWQVPGMWYDIGSHEELEKARDIFGRLAAGEPG